MRDYSVAQRPKKSLWALFEPLYTIPCSRESWASTFFLMEYLLNYLRDEWLREGAMGHRGCPITCCLCLSAVIPAAEFPGLSGVDTNPHVSLVWVFPSWLLSHNSLSSVSLESGIFACSCLSFMSLFLFLGVTVWTRELGLHVSLEHLQPQLRICLPYCKVGIYSTYRYHPALCLLHHSCLRYTLMYNQHFKNI